MDLQKAIEAFIILCQEAGKMLDALYEIFMAVIVKTIPGKRNLRSCDCQLDLRLDLLPYYSSGFL